MRRWSITLLIMLALLFNSTWIMRCGPGSTENNIVSAPASDADLPECCRNGMCPHGHGPHTPPPPPDNPSCTCGMSSTDSSMMMVLAAVPAVLSPSSNDAMVLEPTGNALRMFDPPVIDLNRPPSTPPPKA